MMAILIMRICFTLLIMETLVGMIANGFIVLINCIDWFRGKKLSPNDMILSCLGLSRLAWQAIVILDETLTFFSLDNYIGNSISLVVPSIWIFTNTTNVWFVTWLSVFYLAKIATFSHPVFLQVKQRISGMMPWLLLGSVTLSAIVVITVVTHLHEDLSPCNFYTSLLNGSGSEMKIPDFCGYFDILANVPNFIPFLIFLSSSILLITSLWKHTRCLRRSGTGTQDLNTQAHFTAIKALASFLVLCLSSFVALILRAILVWKNMSCYWPFLLLNNVAAVYPSGHAIILILINPKLKQAWIRMLQHLKCCVSKA